MKKTTILIVILLGFAANINSQNYDSTFFPIGVWSVRGDFRPVDDFLFNVETATAYHEISFENLNAQGFNAAYLSYDPIVNTLEPILSIAETNNIKVIPSLNNLRALISSGDSQTITDNNIIQAINNDAIDLIKSSPATLGYYLYDEPLPGWIDFDLLENARNILTNMTSDAPHPILSTWNREESMTYIDSYLNLDVLMMDAYPFEDGDDIGDISEYMPSYFINDPPPFSDYINTVRENHCESQDRPLWVTIQSFGDMETPENGGYWRQVNPKEIRLQVYLAIMQGAKGIWYFLYESEYPYLMGLLDLSGQETIRLTEVIQINSEINAISETLLKLKVLSDQSGITTNQGEVKIHYDATSANQDKYVIVVNTDVNNMSNQNIIIQKTSIGYDVQSIQNVLTNQTIPFSETATEISFSIPNEEGNGLLFKLSEDVLSSSISTIENNVNIYPNPAKNRLYINSYVTIQSYQIFNNIGQLVKSGVYQKDLGISINKLKRGVFYLKLFSNKKTKTAKFVKI